MMENISFGVTIIASQLIMIKLTPEKDRIVNQAKIVSEQLRHKVWSLEPRELARGMPEWFPDAHQKLMDIYTMLVAMLNEVTAMGPTGYSLKQMPAPLTLEPPTAPERVTNPMMERLYFRMLYLIDVLTQEKEPPLLKVKLTPEQELIVHQAKIVNKEIHTTICGYNSYFDDAARQMPKWFNNAHQKLTDIYNVLAVIHNELVAKRGCKRSAHDAFNE
jgi:hypothetical protein